MELPLVDVELVTKDEIVGRELLLVDVKASLDCIVECVLGTDSLEAVHRRSSVSHCCAIEVMP